MIARRAAGVVLACLAGAMLMSGCARTIVFLDKPAYHYQTGMKFLNQGNLPGARTEFEYAVFLDGGYAQAMLALALVQATEGELEKAAQTMKRFLEATKTATPLPAAPIGAGGGVAP
jgi:outer membrane protein assembly factor BamD (BamD/ComL family)